MPNYETQRYTTVLRKHLNALSTPQKALAASRYFPQGVRCMGVNASDIKYVVAQFHEENARLSADHVLAIAEAVLKGAEYSEENLIAHGLIYKLVKSNYNDALLLRFKYWLENYSSNWSHVDDLCIKTIYQFLIARPHLIATTQDWSYSKSAWCRRASNVVWVKFIKRPIGSAIYSLDKALVFENCRRLISDEDEFVQKSVGWLLKVSAVHHEDDVIDYLRRNHHLMPRSTIRYALEKVDKDVRRKLLAEFK